MSVIYVWMTDDDHKDFLSIYISMNELFLLYLDSSWCENPNPCLNGNCTDVGENFTCSCEEGFEGERCEIGENYWAGFG